MTVLPLWRRSRRDAVAPAEPLAVRPTEVFVFSGGGSLGAAQVGALQALFEAGITPDAVVGTSLRDGPERRDAEAGVAALRRGAPPAGRNDLTATRVSLGQG